MLAGAVRCGHWKCGRGAVRTAICLPAQGSGVRGIRFLLIEAMTIANYRFENGYRTTQDVEVSDMRENMPYTRGYMIIGTSQMFYGSQRLLECQNATDCKENTEDD